MTPDDVIREDLDYICQHLANELPDISGKRIAITGGAGFLGYYLVQALLHWNDIGGGAPATVHVYDNFSRGMPKWLSDLGGDSNLELHKHDIATPLPEDFGPFEYMIHAASIASPIYYRLHPIETMRLARLIILSVSSVLLDQRNLRGPVSRQHSDARDLSRQRFLHRPARVLRRIETLW